MKVEPQEYRTPDGRLVVIRSARPREAGALFDHYLEIRAREPDVNVEEADEWGVTTEAVRRLTEGLERSRNGFLLVAEAGQEIVGILSVEGGRFRKLRHVGEMGVSVNRAWRRLGIGRRLVECAVEKARTVPELAKLSLRVFASNLPALRLYESLGFAVEGRRVAHLRVGGRAEDLLLMGLPLR